MPTTNARIRTLAERALALSNNDIARAVTIMSELTGLSFEMAFAAIDDVATKHREPALREPAQTAE